MCSNSHTCTYFNSSLVDLSVARLTSALGHGACCPQSSAETLHFQRSHRLCVLCTRSRDCTRRTGVRGGRRVIHKSDLLLGTLATIDQHVREGDTRGLVTEGQVEPGPIRLHVKTETVFYRNRRSSSVLVHQTKLLCALVQDGSWYHSVHIVLVHLHNRRAPKSTATAGDSIRQFHADFDGNIGARRRGLTDVLGEHPVILFPFSVAARLNGPTTQTTGIHLPL